MMTKNYTIWLLGGTLLLAGIAHGINMQFYPFLENDEGVYISQAWSLFENGKMSPYYYWYDHAPGGWILLGLWIKLTGGYFTFGHSVASGRVLMLVLQVASTFFLFQIIRHYAKSHTAAVIGSLLFALSPLAIYYHRRVLLDNIMVFWLLAALYVLSARQLTMGRIILGGAFFGIAVASKESALIFGPAFLYVLMNGQSMRDGVRNVLTWGMTSGGIVLLYLIYAFRRSELFPDPTNPDRISLIGTFLSQMDRGTDLFFWQSGSDFMNAFSVWTSVDGPVMYVGIFASGMLCVRALWYKPWRVPAAFVALAWVFFLRGGIVLPFYIPMLIPFLAIATGLVVAHSAQCISRGNRLLYRVSVSILGVLVILPSLIFSQKHFTHDEVRPQLSALAWIQANLEPEDRIIIDQAFYVDLHATDNAKVFDDADWFWKSEYDPAVRQEKYDDQWQSVDYVLATHETLAQSGWGSIPFVKSVLEHSEIIIGWGPQSRDTTVDFENFQSSNGDWAVIYKVQK